MAHMDELAKEARSPDEMYSNREGHIQCLSALVVKLHQSAVYQNAING